MKKTVIFLVIVGVILGALIALVHTMSFKAYIDRLSSWAFIYYFNYWAFSFFWLLGIYTALAIRVWLQGFHNNLENKILIMVNAVVFVMALLSFYQMFFRGMGIWGVNKATWIEPIIQLDIFALAMVVISLISLVIFIWKYIQRIKN
ncbi:MAG: hypothetical protein MUC49_12925 [Raineya sp.]|jgi:hypothetical protein|nr:hypothetical protein [Raineya sp.]